MEVEQGQAFPRLLTVEDVAEILCVPLSTVHHWAVRGEGPPSFKVGKHRVSTRRSLQRGSIARSEKSHDREASLA